MTSITDGTATVYQGGTIDVVDWAKFSPSGEGTNVTLSGNNTPVSVTNRVVIPYESLPGTTMYGPSCMIFTTNAAMPVRIFNGNPETDCWTYLIDLYKDNASARYNGDTYDARLLNVYIASSKFISIANTSVEATGDMFVTMFDTLIAGIDTKVTNYDF